MSLGYRMYDADNHLYEAADAFTRHLPAHRRKDFYWTTDERGHRHIILGGKHFDYLPNPTFDPIAVAGCLLEVFAGEKSMLETKNTAYTFERLAGRPEYQDRRVRVQRMDDQEVEAALLFPTLVSGVEEATGSDVDLTVDLLWSFNRWLEEEWGFAYQDRLFATPVVSLSDLDEAVRLLEWALERGARAIMVRPSPVPTRMGMRSPADPMFDPFWARAQEAGVLVCGHLSATGYHRYSGDWTGVYEFAPHRPQGPFASIATHGRATMDFFTASRPGAVTGFPRCACSRSRTGRIGCTGSSSGSRSNTSVIRATSPRSRWPPSSAASGSSPTGRSHRRADPLRPGRADPGRVGLSSLRRAARAHAVRQGAGPVLRRRRPTDHAGELAGPPGPGVVALTRAVRGRPAPDPPGPPGPVRAPRPRSPSASGSGLWPPPTATPRPWSAPGAG